MCGPETEQSCQPTCTRKLIHICYLLLSNNNINQRKWAEQCARAGAMEKLNLSDRYDAMRCDVTQSICSNYPTKWLRHAHQIALLEYQSDVCWLMLGPPAAVHVMRGAPNVLPYALRKVQFSLRCVTSRTTATASDNHSRSVKNVNKTKLIWFPFQ